MRFVPIVEILYLHADVLGTAGSEHRQVVDSQLVHATTPLIAGDRNAHSRSDGSKGRVDDGEASIDGRFNGTRPSKEEISRLLKNRVERVAAINYPEKTTLGLARENARHTVRLTCIACHSDSHRAARP